MPERTDVIRSPKWVRVLFAGDFVADSRRVLLVRNLDGPPVYYFPHDDVRMDMLVDGTPVAGGSPRARFWSVRAGDHVAARAAFSHPTRDELEGYIGFAWDSMDAWFEEDEEVFVHPRDPSTRVEALPSSRHVRVVLAGVTVASSQRPVLLFETGLPTRYYVPRTDVRLDLLVPSKTTTRCPYKGVATHYSVRVGGRLVQDIAWSYLYPTRECGRIATMLSFYGERVEGLFVDGVIDTSR